MVLNYEAKQRTKPAIRDQGLEEAIRAAGGVGELARRIGISQPSVSNWERVPAERVASVEAATGVERRVLRPDLFDEKPLQSPIDEIDAARSRGYALLATLLVRSPDTDLLKALSRLGRDGDNPLAAAHQALAAAAAQTDAKRVEQEYFDLFIGVGRGELVPYASYYLTGFLHDRPLARLRADLKAAGIVRAEGLSEPEDHAAILCEIMAGLADGRYGTPRGCDADIFQRHLAPWIGRFFADLEGAAAADFYASVGALGRTFIEIETEAFALPA
jgi:TorA maturation chaperone TorD